MKKILITLIMINSGLIFTAEVHTPRKKLEHKNYYEKCNRYNRTESAHVGIGIPEGSQRVKPCLSFTEWKKTNDNFNKIVMDNDLKSAQELLSTGTIDIDYKDSDGQPIIFAASFGALSIPLIDLLLKNDAQINALSDYDKTVLDIFDIYFSADDINSLDYKKHKEIYNYLLSKGALTKKQLNEKTRVSDQIPSLAK